MTIFARRDSLSTPAAFTIAEVCVCLVIVGVMLAAALQTLGQSSVLQFRITERARARQLARMLMNEITQQEYIERTASPLFGAEAGETRATYDDVDDYHGLNESPPVNKDGTTFNVPFASTWKRTVTVVWANPATLAAASPQLDSGVKLITVSVYHKNVLITTLSAVRSNAP